MYPTLHALCIQTTQTSTIRCKWWGVHIYTPNAGEQWLLLVNKKHLFCSPKWSIVTDIQVTRALQLFTETHDAKHNHTKHKSFIVRYRNTLHHTEVVDDSVTSRGHYWQHTSTNRFMGLTLPPSLCLPFSLSFCSFIVPNALSSSSLPPSSQSFSPSFSFFLRSHLSARPTTYPLHAPPPSVFVSSSDPARPELLSVPIWIGHSWCCHWKQGAITAAVYCLSERHIFMMIQYTPFFSDIVWAPSLISHTIFRVLCFFPHCIDHIPPAGII